jgi:hypothetical protein
VVLEYAQLESSEADDADVAAAGLRLIDKHRAAFEKLAE